MSAITPVRRFQPLHWVVIALLGGVFPSILLGQPSPYQPAPPPQTHDPLPDYLTPGLGWEPQVTFNVSDIARAHIHSPVRGYWVPDMRNPHLFRLVVPRREPVPVLAIQPDPARIERRGTFAWLAWWEVNRDAYLKPRLPSDARSSDLLVALDALIRAAHSPNPVIRAEAALAMGRLKQGRALEVLVELTQDKDDIVKLRAWTAIGLLDSPRAAQFLMSNPAASPLEQIGWTLAAGLLSAPDENIARRIRAQMTDGKNPEAQRLAVWAIRTHPAPENRQLLLKTIQSTRSFFVLREALIGLGNIPKNEDLPQLSAILHGVSQNGAVPMIDDLIAVMSKPGPNAHAPAAKLTPELSAQLGEKQTLLTATALAMGKHKVDFTDKDVVPALNIGLTPVLERINRIGDTTPSATPPLPTISERGERLIALGRIDHPAGNRVLFDGLDLFAMRDPENICRSFSSLAMGLSLRDESESRVDSQFRLHTAFDHIEQGGPRSELVYDVRAASALAMGLAAHPEVCRKLKLLLVDMRPGQDLTFGYAALALGMFNDPDVTALAGNYLGPAVPGGINGDALAAAYALNADGGDFDELMTRRALVQGIAAQGDYKSLPLLMGEWGRSEALSLEVARALGWCRRPLDVAPTTNPFIEVDPSLAVNRELLSAYVDAMCKLATAKDTKPALAATAAASLGLFFEADDVRTRLAGLIINTDFATSMQPPEGRRISLTYKYASLGYPQQQILVMPNPYYYLSMRLPPLHPTPG